MKFSKSNQLRRLLVAGTAIACLVAGTAAPAADEGVAAVWIPKELRFTYMGFTSHYSCDGLRDKMRAVLLKLGVRKDLSVTATGCSEGFGRVSPFPGVVAKFHLLQALTEENAPKEETKPVSAHWQNVDLAPTGDPLRAAGDCELTEQIKQRVLPLFSTRNIAYSSTCVPNQLTVGGTKLAADVLMTDQKSNTASTAP
jgi:hypothetical protein